MNAKKSFEVKINGMDCADCAAHVQNALCGLPEVTSAQVLLGAEKAIIHYEDLPPTEDSIANAVKDAGYEAVFDRAQHQDKKDPASIQSFGKASIMLFIAIVLGVLGISILGERSGFFVRLQVLIPWFFWLGAIIFGGWPVFLNVFRSLLKKRIISHTLMTASVLTAIIVGEWTTALLIVLFMRLGDFIESSTTEKARQAVHKLRQAAPQNAHLVKDGQMVETRITELKVGDIVQVKPGESIPVDGEVLDGRAFVDQSAITGESMPVELAPGSHALTASVLQSGTLRIRTRAAGKESLFGRIISLVEEAEANRGYVQTLADKFSGIYLPIVGAAALITYIISGNAIAAAAVMAVSCSCSFSLATPVAMLASIGSAAQSGLLFKGGKYIEILEKIDTLLVDKTGTLTLGKPRITDIHLAKGYKEDEILRLAASVEQVSEHPLADAVMLLASERGLPFEEVMNFSNTPGKGVSATVGNEQVEIWNKPQNMPPDLQKISDRMREEGKTLLFIHINGNLAAILGAEDVLRADTHAAITALRKFGIHEITLLSGDNAAAVRSAADELGIDYRAEMLPQEKIAYVKEKQKAGSRVMMIGDGINDAPALAQADIGVAMGRSGTDIAMETAHIVLLREDWSLIPQAFQIAKRTMRVVRLNIFFTAVYNLFGISLAAIGILPPAIAAAMQSIPDIGIMANSARLIKRK